MKRKISFFYSNTGTTLVELMVALIIIAMIVLGGSMFFFQSRILTVREAHRRAAVLVASERLEKLKAANYSDIAAKDLNPGGNPYYIVWRNSDWKCLGELIEDPGSENFSYDYVMVDNLTNQKMLTEAQLIDDNGDNEYDYLHVTTKVEWINGSPYTVSLTTLITSR